MKTNAISGVLILAGTLAVSSCGSRVFAQAGLRETLEKMDVNGNGMIESDEVTPLARPYLERIIIGRSGRVDEPFRRPMRIDRIQESARIYYALRNGVAGNRVASEPRDMIRGFEPDRDQILVPDFGLAEIRFPYVQADVDEARETMDRYDDDGDGFIDRREARYGRWTHRNPFDDDLNGDDRLSLMEFTQRYARRRLLEGDAEELVRRAWRTGGEIESSEKSRGKNGSEWWQKGGSSHWLTAALVGRFDKNRNGTLDMQEAMQMGLPIAGVDTDGDGEISRDEMLQLVGEMQAEAGDVTEGLPGWFFELDVNNDGQVAMHEFSEDWSLAKREEFEDLDINRDGLLTSGEVLQAASVTGGDYRNETAEVLPPRRTVISEIEVEDDFPIKDLNLQLSITHTNTSFLDAYLTGPDGDRVELFTEVGGGGDHFEKTTFDDQASKPVAKGKPPFSGVFRPEAIDKRQPGLAVFNGKSTRGVWQLVIRGTRSERFGMLHSWGIIVEPESDDKVLSAQSIRDPSESAVESGGKPTTENADSGKSKQAEEDRQSSGNARRPELERSSSGNAIIELLDKVPF